MSYESYKNLEDMEADIREDYSRLKNTANMITDTRDRLARTLQKVGPLYNDLRSTYTNFTNDLGSTYDNLGMVTDPFILYDLQKHRYDLLMQAARERITFPGNWPNAYEANDEGRSVRSHWEHTGHKNGPLVYEAFAQTDARDVSKE